MASYVMLFHYTHQGIEHVKQSSRSRRCAEENLQQAWREDKGTLRVARSVRYALRLLMRPTTKRSPNFPLYVAEQGNARIETHRAFSPRQNFASCCRRSTNHPSGGSGNDP